MPRRPGEPPPAAGTVQLIYPAPPGGGQPDLARLYAYPDRRHRATLVARAIPASRAILAARAMLTVRAGRGSAPT